MLGCGCKTSVTRQKPGAKLQCGAWRAGGATVSEVAGAAPGFCPTVESTLAITWP
jgi:hypothetical protein